MPSATMKNGADARKLSSLTARIAPRSECAATVNVTVASDSSRTCVTSPAMQASSAGAPAHGLSHTLATARAGAKREAWAELPMPRIDSLRVQGLTGIPPDLDEARPHGPRHRHHDHQ